MKNFLVCLTVVLPLAATADAQEQPHPDTKSVSERTPLWAGPAPVGDGKTEDGDAFFTVHRPAKPNGTAVVICPGGGYRMLVTGGEGHGIAKWLNKHGITGIVLEYRLPAGRHAVPLLDAQRTIRTVRANAKKWQLDTAKVGIMGFSAGGHLASTAATHFDNGKKAAEDPIERVSCRPDFAILVYPVVTMGAKTHGGSKKNLLGTDPTPELMELYSNESQVTADTPPMFLAHAVDDKPVPPDNSRALIAALKKNNVPSQYLELPSGGHGLNGYKGPMWDAWQKQSLEWLVAVQNPTSTTNALPRSTPESQGVSSAAIRDFIQSADSQLDSMHSFMLVRHGQVVAEAWWEPQSADKPYILWSLSKSFTSTAVGLAIAEGKLSLDDRVMKFFPDDAPAKPTWKLKAMRVRDLLTMNTGHQDEVNWRASKNWAKAFLAHPVPHKPGTHFRYNTPATYMLSAIVQKVTGETVLDYLTPRLFEPLGIPKPKWDKSPQGISIGGYGLYLRTEDIARFGQLYLQRGKWNGKQVVPEEWVDAATSKQVSNGSDPTNDWDQGYGFQFWRCRHQAYRGDGKDGQFCIVLPEQDAVIAITANIRDMKGELDLVWEKLLPAFSDGPLEESPEEYARLKAVIGGLKASR